MRAVEEPRAVRARAGVGKLRLARLLDDAVVALEGVDGLLDGDRVSDLDRAGQRRAGMDRLEDLEAALVAEVEGVGRLGLGADDARLALDETESGLAKS